MINEVGLIPVGIIHYDKIITYEFYLYNNFEKVGYLSYDAANQSGSGEINNINVKFKRKNKIIYVNSKINFLIENTGFCEFEITYREINFFLNINTYEHLAEITNSNDQKKYTIPMALNQTLWTILKGLLHIISFGYIQRSKNSIIIPKNLNGDENLQFIVLIAITILRLSYYQTDFSPPAN